MQRNYMIGKGASGASKAPVASYSAPAPKGATSTLISASGTNVGHNRIYALSTQ